MPTQDLTLTVDSATVTAIAGTSVSLKVSTVTTGGFTGLTTLGIGSLPTGVSASFTPPALGPNASGILTLTTTGSTPLGAQPIEIRGTASIGGTATTRTATATLSVQAPGQTYLAGQVRDEDDKPLAGVTITLVGTPSQTLGTSDAGGNFLVPVPVAGSQVFLIDGSTANSGSITFHTIPITVALTSGIVNPLGFIVYLHIRPATQPLPVAPSVATSITFPNAPDLTLTLPAGVWIIAWDGQPNTQVGLRTVPLDRLPLPPIPAGQETDVAYMFSFVKVGGGRPIKDHEAIRRSRGHPPSGPKSVGSWDATYGARAVTLKGLGGVRSMT